MKKFLSFSLVAVLMASCGSPRSTVRVVNKAEGVTTTVSTNVGAGGSTTVSVAPVLDVDVDSTEIL